jgi:hypothetical protein
MCKSTGVVAREGRTSCSRGLRVRGWATGESGKGKLGAEWRRWDVIFTNEL